MRRVRFAVLFTLCCGSIWSQESFPEEPHLIGRIERIERFQVSPDLLLIVKPTKPEFVSRNLTPVRHPTFVRLPSGVPVWEKQPGGKPTRTEPEVGDRILVWFSGPLQLTLPPRATAKEIVITRRVIRIGP